MAITDIAVILFLLFQMIMGAYQGFLRALIGPLAVGLSLWISWMVYIQTRSLPLAMLMNLGLPIILSILMHKALKAWDDDLVTPLGMIISGMGGLLVSTLWGALIAVACVTILAIAPLEQLNLGHAGDDIRRSATFSAIRPFLLQKKLLPEVRREDVADCLSDTCSMDPQKMSALGEDPELKEIMADPRIEALTHDQAFIDAGRRQDIAALLRNPALTELAKDPELIGKLLKIFPKIQALRNK